MIAGMTLPYQRFRQFVRLGPGLLSWGRKPKSSLPDPRPEFMPELGAKKKAEIVRVLEELNRAVLKEIDRPDD